MCLAPSSKEVNQQTLLTNSSSLFMPINREVTPNDTYTHTHTQRGLLTVKVLERNNWQWQRSLLLHNRGKTKSTSEPIRFFSLFFLSFLPPSFLHALV